ncbi:MAG: insulinase family protein [Nitrospirae bacterium]|nr:insulinase family protein [Nitrospirota bacterium]
MREYRAHRKKVDKIKTYFRRITSTSSWGFLFFIFLFMLSGCSGLRSFIENPDQSYSSLAPFTKKVLDNGLTVIVKEVHSTPIVAVYFWVNTGSVNENPKIMGISHFYEHMFFKGTERRKVGDMDRIIKGLGGYNNAFTSVEYTSYYVVVPSENFSTAFDILFDALTKSVFPPVEVDKEREVVKREIDRSEDIPLNKLSNEFRAEIFKGTPYAQPVLGTQETLDGIGRRELLKYKRNFYVPNNMSVVVVGNINTDEVITQIKEATRDFKPDPQVKSRLAHFTFIPQEKIREKTFEKDVKQTYMLLGFPDYGRANMKEVYVLDVASTILGGGRSSRLYQRLLEKEGLVTSVSAWIWPLKEAGVFAVQAVFSPKNFERVKTEVLEEVGKMREEPISEKELKRAKMMLKADFAFSNETDAAMAATLGRYETIAQAKDALVYVQEIDKVTVADIKRVMSKYARGNNYTLCAIVPRKPAAPLKIEHP